MPRSALGPSENGVWVAADGGPRLEPPKPARTTALPVSSAGAICTVGGVFIIESLTLLASCRRLL